MSMFISLLVLATTMSFCCCMMWLLVVSFFSSEKRACGVVGMVMGIRWWIHLGVQIANLHMEAQFHFMQY